MKKSLSGLDLIALTKELQVLVGSRIDKFYQPDRGSIAITITPKGERKLRLHVLLSGWIWLSKSATEMPLSPTNFASLLRKYLSNARIISVEQHGCDRIIELKLQKEIEYRLIFELFSEGNVILVSSDGSIAALMKQKKWKSRELKIRGEYSYPTEAFDPRTGGKERFVEIVKSSNADIVRTLATKVNIGGDYAEEICKIAGIKKDISASEAGEKELESLWIAIRKFLRALENDLSPHVALKDGIPDYASPVSLFSESGESVRKFPSFSEAIENYVCSISKEPEEQPEDEERARLKRTLATQEAAAKRLMTDINRSQKIAEYIFSNYDIVEKKLSEVREGIENDELPGDSVLIDKFGRRFRTSISGIELMLDWSRSARENAQSYYEDVKRMKEKLDGNENAMDETKKRIKQREKEEAEKKKIVKHKSQRSKLAWFEHYRWFLSSEGVIVIAGKDAKSNEQLVKKHLQPKDRYVHADIHGAPSVVVKSIESMTAATLMEAAIFSLAMSKAWNAGIGSGSGYWVTPEQVSKTPQSGEHLAKGAFVIRGKRNYFERLPLRLAIGVCAVEGVEKVMCGPVQAVSKNCKDYVELVPGKTSKESATKELSSRFSQSIDDIQAVMPPGGVTLIEKK